MGASMVKYITPLPCKFKVKVIENYILTLNFVKEKIINILRTH